MTNIGLIGCGRVACVHMLAYKYIENANVVAVSDIDLERAKIFANRYGVKKYFKNYVDLLEIKDLDFVDICTPVSTHANITCDAAEFGQDVLVEKPMALSTSECERMILESKRRGVRLCVCHNQLFIPSVMQAKSMVDSGYYDLTSFRISHKESTEVPSWTLTPEEKGILWETGCHAAYLQLHFLKNIREVYAVGSKVKYPVYDEFTVLLRTSHRPYGIIELSWLAKEPEILFEIDCSDGKRVQIILRHDYLLEKSKGLPKHVWSGLYSDEKRILKKWMKLVLNSLRKGKLLYCLTHFSLISSYIESLKNDSPPPVEPEEGKRAIKLLECIEESLSRNQVVQIK